jgi:hypothetical protein
VLNPSALAILIPRPPPFARCLTRTLMPRSSIRTTRAGPSATSWHHILDVDQVIFDDRIGRILRENRPFIRSSTLSTGGRARASLP